MTTDNLHPFDDRRTDEARHNRTAWTWGFCDPAQAPTSAEADPADFPGFLEQVAMSIGNADRAGVLMAQANLHATQNVERALERMTTQLGLILENTGSTAEGTDRIHNRLGTLQETVVEASSAAALTVVDSLEEMAPKGPTFTTFATFANADEAPETMAERGWSVQVGEDEAPDAAFPVDADTPREGRPYMGGDTLRMFGEVPITAKIDGGPTFLITGWTMENGVTTLTTEPIPNAAPVEVSAEFVGQPETNAQAEEEDTRDYSGVHDYVADEEEGDEDDVIPQGDAHEAASRRRAENLATDEAAGRAFRQAAEDLQTPGQRHAAAIQRVRKAAGGPNRSWPTPSADTTTPVDDALAESTAAMPNVTWPSSGRPVGWMAKAADRAILDKAVDAFRIRMGWTSAAVAHRQDEMAEAMRAAFVAAFGPDQ